MGHKALLLVISILILCLSIIPYPVHAYDAVLDSTYIIRDADYLMVLGEFNFTQDYWVMLNLTGFEKGLDYTVASAYLCMDTYILNGIENRFNVSYADDLWDGSSQFTYINGIIRHDYALSSFQYDMIGVYDCMDVSQQVEDALNDNLYHVTLIIHNEPSPEYITVPSPIIYNTKDVSDSYRALAQVQSPYEAGMQFNGKYDYFSSGNTAYLNVSYSVPSPSDACKRSVIINSTSSLDETVLRWDARNESMFVKWDFSIIPDYVMIDSADLCYYVTQLSDDPDGILDVTRIIDSSWSEISSVNKFNGLLRWDGYLTSIGSVVEEYACINVTDVVRAEYINDSRVFGVEAYLQEVPKYADYLTRLPCGLKVGDDEMGGRRFVFEDSDDDENTTYLPYLRINYTLNSVMTIDVVSPVNATYHDGVPLIWDGTGDAFQCWYVLDGNPVSIDMGQDVPDLNVSAGQHQLNVTCSGMSDQTENVSSPTVWFTKVAPCTESWQQEIGECDDGMSFITYMDESYCNTTSNISAQSPPNGTYSDCSGNIFRSGSYVLLFKQYPYFLIGDNPESVFVETYSSNGSRTMLPDVTLNLTDTYTGASYLFSLGKNNASSRHEMYLSFDAGDAGHNFSLRFYTDIAGFGESSTGLYVRNHSCQVYIRLWADKNQSQRYNDDFGLVMAKSGMLRNAYTPIDYAFLVPVYDDYIQPYLLSNSSMTFSSVYGGYSPKEWFTARYHGGEANLTLYDTDDYELRFSSGSFIIPNNYGRYLAEREDSNLALGTYRLTCSPAFNEIRNYYVSKMDFGFFDGWVVMGWLVVMLFVSLLAGLAAIWLIGSVRVGAIVAIGLFIAMAVAFFGFSAISLLNIHMV